jgi:hypothetical protein
LVVSNDYGWVTSENAVLQIGEPPSLVNLVQNGSFELPPTPGAYLLFRNGDSIEGGWTVENTSTYFSIYENTADYIQGLWQPTAAGSQFVYLADNVGSTVLRQDLTQPLSADKDYNLSLLQSGFYPARGLLAEVTVTLSPSGTSEPVFSRTFKLPD